MQPGLQNCATLGTVKTYNLKLLICPPLQLTGPPGVVKDELPTHQLGKNGAVLPTSHLGMAYTWPSCYRRQSPPLGRRSPPPPPKTRGIFDPPTWGSHRGLVVSVCSTEDQQVGGSNLPHAWALWLPPVVHDWVIKGLSMSSRISVTGRSRNNIFNLLYSICLGF